jgi:hypothetical protein
MYEQAWKEWVESGDAELWDNLPWEDLDDVVAETEEGDSEAGCN